MQFGPPIAALVFTFYLWSQAASRDAVTLPFVHDPSKTSRKHLLESVGSGVALLDYDGDGRLDIYLVNGAELLDPTPKGHSPDKSQAKYWNRLYRNQGDGKFDDVTERAGVRGLYYGMGTAAADYDNDGDIDLFVTGYPANQLFRNNGDGTFTDVAAKLGIAGGGWSTGAAWLDVDADGKLDLAVVQYMQWDFEPDKWCGPPKPQYRSYCHPDTYPAAAYSLYRNAGDRFVDKSESSGFGKSPGKGLGIGVADYDLDGKLDIAVANDAAPQQLFRNLGGFRFAEIGFDSNIAYDDEGRVFSGMGIDFFDYDNDGRPDLLINALAQQRYALYRNTAKGFEYVSTETGLAALTRNHSGWGVGAADFDNDGWQDIAVAQGHVMDNIELAQPAVKYKEPLLLLKNVGAKFIDASAARGPAFLQARASRGAAFGDLNNDGSVDMVVSSQLDPAAIFYGPKTANHWLLLKLAGSTSNRDAIGALIRIEAGGVRQTRTITTAGSYISSNDVRAHFGLGASKTISVITVQWPSGKLQTLKDVPADQILELREPLRDP